MKLIDYIKLLQEAQKQYGEDIELVDDAYGAQHYSNEVEGVAKPFKPKSIWDDSLQTYVPNDKLVLPIIISKESKFSNVE